MKCLITEQDLHTTTTHLMEDLNGSRGRRPVRPHTVDRTMHPVVQAGRQRRRDKSGSDGVTRTMPAACWLAPGAVEQRHPSPTPQRARCGWALGIERQEARGRGGVGSTGENKGGWQLLAPGN